MSCSEMENKNAQNKLLAHKTIRICRLYVKTAQQMSFKCGTVHNTNIFPI